MKHAPNNSPAYASTGSRAKDLSDRHQGWSFSELAEAFRIVKTLKSVVDEFDFAGCGVSDSAAAGLIGNAQSLNVVMAIMPHLLFLSQLITKKEYLLMKASNNRV